MTTLQGWPVQGIGARNAEVGNVQRFLNRVVRADLLVVDEIFGPKTKAALVAYQSLRSLPQTGKLDELTRAKATREGFIPFVQAKGFTLLPRRDIRKIVIHTMEFPEKPGAAVQVARWFAGPSAPRASAHYCLDNADTVQCVRDSDIAWHAPGANHDGLGIEHAGYAAQTTLNWDDTYSRAVLQRSAELVAQLCASYNIPPSRLESVDLSKPGIRGICGHADVSKAFNGTHWDPGPGFPWAKYLQLVQNLMP